MKTKFFVITYADGRTDWAEGATYGATMSHAEDQKEKHGGEYTIEEYDSYKDYMNNI